MKFQDFMRGREKLCMAFLGGSITEGAGSSVRSNCFVSLVTKAVAETYPEVEVTGVNAGVGGTPSTLGMFRLDRDVLSKEPDILFLEFAVNDYELEETGIYMENIIRRARQYRADLPIVLLYTFVEPMIADYDAGKLPRSIEKHMRLAEAYGLPQVNVGYDLYRRSGLPGQSFLAEYLKDSAHPNDKGYRGYADIILEHLWEMDFTVGTPEAPVFESLLKEPGFLLGELFADEVWKLSEKSMFGRLDNYIYSDLPGAELQFTFSGTMLGIYYTIEKDSGCMEYAVDDGPWKECNMWDEFALSFGRAAFTVLEGDLEPGFHRVRIRNSGRREERSEGYVIRLGAFCIG